MVLRELSRWWCVGGVAGEWLPKVKRRGAAVVDVGREEV
jgi:hypothetical protein